MTENKQTNRAPGRPLLPPSDRRSERISFGVTKVQKAAFLVNAAQAGLTSNDYARQLLCRDPDCELDLSRRSNFFELIDVLSRIGADLASLRHIAQQTDIIPKSLDEIITRLDTKLDNLIVGSGIADELHEHRAKLLEIAQKLETQKEMSAKARGMITTFDQVVRKVLSA